MVSCAGELFRGRIRHETIRHEMPVIQAGWAFGAMVARRASFPGSGILRGRFRPSERCAEHYLELYRRASYNFAGRARSLGSAVLGSLVMIRLILKTKLRSSISDNMNGHLSG